MDKIEFSHFKAFKKDLVVSDIDGKNLVICGENGAGKSSIYEGIKLASYYKKLRKCNVNTPVGTPGYDNAIETWISKDYQNKNALQDVFALKLDNHDYKDYEDNRTDVFFLISHSDILSSDRIILKSLLSEAFFPIDNVDEFLTTLVVDDIIAKTNSVLKDKLAETIVLSTSPQDGAGYVITIEDKLKKPLGHENLKSLFNEAKLHLVKLTLLLELAKKMPVPEGVKKVLVLDDIISSLDAGNRTFLLNYIIGDFVDFQKIILTHNVGFYNLSAHVVNNNFSNQIPKWTYRMLYELDDDSFIYEYKTDDHDVADLLNQVKHCDEHTGNDQIQALGNRLRKRFEELTVELSHMFLFGDMAVSEEILNSIASPNSALYMKKNPNGGLDTYVPMLKDIKNLVDCPNPNHEEIRNKIKDVYTKYTDHDNLKVIRSTLESLRLYQKVVLHPMSHGAANVNFSMKELKITALLIEQMEKAVNKIYKGNRGNNVNDMN